MKFGKTTKSIFWKWLPFAVAISGLTMLVYVAVQQNLRQGANDPQIAIAEDTAYRLANGADATALVPENSIDIAQSLVPYVIIYDIFGRPVAGSGMIGGALPMLPKGIYEYARTHGQDRVTWQPRKGVRSALIVQYYGGEDGRVGYVAVGRSLREVEVREWHLIIYAKILWLWALAGVWIVLWLKMKMAPKIKPSTRRRK